MDTAGAVIGASAAVVVIFYDNFKALSPVSKRLGRWIIFFMMIILH